MRKRAKDDGRSLFDDIEEDSQDQTVATTGSDPEAREQKVREAATQDSQERVREGLSGDSEWREVPQALFLSWSAARQYAYCAERDLRASVEFATSPEEEQWFYQRAVSYTKMKDECLRSQT